MALRAFGLRRAVGRACPRIPTQVARLHHPKKPALLVLVLSKLSSDRLLRGQTTYPLLCLDVLPGTRIALPSFYHLCPDHPDRTAPLLRYGTSLRSSIASHGPPVTASPSRARVLFGTSHVTSAASQQTATGQRPGSSCQRSAPASPPAFRIGQRPVNRAAFV
ncbi:hypothetical protein ACCO45_001158 [Purpureocillium lilacinum]|uniref:Uncharacterized protein n=1 Tax=Purpureocillium lilacinum TaxID=33203 RepID=A0ACC4E8U9_PURLI